MDINALLQMLQKRFGQGGGGQQAFAGGNPGFHEGIMHLQSPGDLNAPPQMGSPATTPAPFAGNNMNLGGTGGGSSPMGGGNVMQSIMQMMQQSRGGMGRQMNLG